MNHLFDYTIPAYARLLEYMQLDRKGIIAVASEHPGHGEWWEDAHWQMTFFDIVKLMLRLEFGYYLANDAIHAYRNRPGSPAVYHTNGI